MGQSAPPADAAARLGLQKPIDPTGGGDLPKAPRVEVSVRPSR